MPLKRTSVSDCLIGVSVLAALLALMPACAVNRHVVRAQTQVQLMNEELATRETAMGRDFDAMTQLMQHNAAALEGVNEKFENMRHIAAASGSEKELSELTDRLDHLRDSASELNRRMAEMETRASATRELQYGLLRLVAVPNPRPTTKTGTTTHKEADLVH